MDIQLNELSKGNKASNNLNIYSLGSKKKDGKSDIPDQPSRVEKPAKDATNRIKENKSQNPSLVAKYPFLEVR